MIKRYTSTIHNYPYVLYIMDDTTCKCKVIILTGKTKSLTVRPSVRLNCCRLKLGHVSTQRLLRQLLINNNGVVDQITS